MIPLLQSRELTLPGGDLSRSFLARTEDAWNTRDRVPVAVSVDLR